MILINTKIRKRKDENTNETFPTLVPRALPVKTEKPWGPKISEDNLPMAFVGSLKDNRFEVAS